MSTTCKNANICCVWYFNHIEGEGRTKVECLVEGDIDTLFGTIQERRAFEKATHKHFLDFFTFEVWDFTIENGQLQNQLGRQVGL